MRTLPNNAAVLMQLADAIEAADRSAFSEALAQTPPPSQDDDWPLEMVNWVIQRRCATDQERQTMAQCATDLLVILMSPASGKRDWLMEKVFTLDAMHLWDPFIAAGFPVNADRMLTVLLSHRDASIALTQDRKIQWFEKLFQSDFAPSRSNQHQDNSRPATPLEHVLKSNQFDLIPFFHAAGYTLPNTHDNRLFIAEALSAGIWPFPDLLLPDCLMQEETWDHLCNRFRAGQFSQFSFLKDPAHVEKFCALPLHDRAWVRTMLTSAITSRSTPWQSGTPVTIAPDAVKCLLLLHDHQLIDLDMLLLHSTLSSTPDHLIETTRDIVAGRQLNEQTAAAPRPRNSVKRL